MLKALNFRNKLQLDVICIPLTLVSYNDPQDDDEQPVKLGELA